MVNRIKFRKLYRWFSKTPNFGIILPDGWFGRPYDNIYRFSELINKNYILTLHFKEGERLGFQDYTFSVSKEKIIFESKGPIIFTRPTKEKNRRTGLRYQYGRVELIPYNLKKRPNLINLLWNKIFNKK